MRCEFREMGTPGPRNLISVRCDFTIYLFLEGARNKREMSAPQARNPTGLISWLKKCDYWIIMFHKMDGKKDRLGWLSENAPLPSRIKFANWTAQIYPTRETNYAGHRGKRTRLQEFAKPIACFLNYLSWLSTVPLNSGVQPALSNLVVKQICEAKLNIHAQKPK